MCKGTLWVNPSTGEVVDHKAADHQKADLNQFLKTQKDRGSLLEDKFKKARLEQDRRKQSLNERFKDARKLADASKEDMGSPFQWD